MVVGCYSKRVKNYCVTELNTDQLDCGNKGNQVLGKTSCAGCSPFAPPDHSLPFSRLLHVQEGQPLWTPQQGSDYCLVKPMGRPGGDHRAKRSRIRSI